jgi:hypothetical protein
VDYWEAYGSPIVRGASLLKSFKSNKLPDPMLWKSDKGCLICDHLSREKCARSLCIESQPEGMLPGGCRVSWQISKVVCLCVLSNRASELESQTAKPFWKINAYIFMVALFLLLSGPYTE